MWRRVIERTRAKREERTTRPAMPVEEQERIRRRHSETSAPILRDFSNETEDCQGLTIRKQQPPPMNFNTFVRIRLVAPYFLVPPNRTVLLSSFVYAFADSRISMNWFLATFENVCRVLLVGHQISSRWIVARLPRPMCCSIGLAPNEPPPPTVRCMDRLATTLSPALSTATVIRAPIADRLLVTPTKRILIQSLPPRDSRTAAARADRRAPHRQSRRQCPRRRRDPDRQTRFRALCAARPCQTMQSRSRICRLCSAATRAAIPTQTTGYPCRGTCPGCRRCPHPR